MTANHYPGPALLQAIATLRHELTEAECRRRAERMAQQSSEEGRAAMVTRLRQRRQSVDVPEQ